MHYVGVVVTALVVLLLGCWNPKLLQQKKDDKPTGCPSYLWISLIALLVGLLTCLFMHQNRMMMY